MNSQKQKDMSVIETAAFWATCLEDDGLTRPEREELARWLRKSPEHVKELLLAQALLTDAAGIDPDKQIDVEALLANIDRNIVPLNRISPATTVPDGNQGEGQTATNKGKRANAPRQNSGWRQARGHMLALPRTLPRTFVAMAASIMLVAVALTLVTGPFGDPRQFYGTGIGEQRSLSLADGSVIHLNTQSEVQVRYGEGERTIYLLKGEALFDVAPNPERPFRVHVGETVAQALGTSFNVYRKGAETEVAVLEGTVSVSRAGADAGDTVTGKGDAATEPKLLATLTKGQEVSVATSGAVTTRAVADIQKVVYWRQRKLIFEDAPVSEIAREFNRYNTVQIVIENVGVAEPQFSGVFEVDKPNVFVKTLEASGAIVRRPAGQNQVIVNFATFRSKGTPLQDV